jgi:hypothetical protein
MPSASDTAYPRLKINPTAKELNELYSPTVYELAFAQERARQPMQRAGLLLLLKTFQRLGYFVSCAEIPIPIGAMYSAARPLTTHLSNCKRMMPVLPGIDIPR